GWICFRWICLRNGRSLDQWPRLLKKVYWQIKGRRVNTEAGTEVVSTSRRRGYADHRGRHRHSVGHGRYRHFARASRHGFHKPAQWSEVRVESETTLTRASSQTNVDAPGVLLDLRVEELDVLRCSCGSNRVHCQRVI